MIVKVKYKGLAGDQNKIIDVECSDTELCEISGHPEPINDHEKWCVVFENIEKLSHLYEIVGEQ